MTHLAPAREVRAAYWLGSIVFLRTRQERLPGMVTGVSVKPTGVIYCVGWGDGKEDWHYEMELTAEYIAEFVEGRES